MASLPSFHKDKVQQALDAAASHNELFGTSAGDSTSNLLAGGEYMVRAQCISVTVQDNKICLNLPLGIGSVCIPIPVSVPNGTAAEACLDICTTWGIPTGVKVTISALGHVVVTKTFGKC